MQHFLRRAKDFEYSMKLCRDTSLDKEVQLVNTGIPKSNESLQSAALLGIHAAMSYADALRIGLGDPELSADDHKLAVRRLEKAIPAKHIQDKTGIQRFNALVGSKTVIAYGKGRINDNDLKSLVESSQRFSAWINRLGKELKVEGWGNVAAE